METILFSIIRTVAAFITLLFVSRLMGRKSISQITFFDFAVAITLGSITANISLGTNMTFASGITVLLTFCALGLIAGIVHISSFRLRKLINSEPVVIISNGEIIKKNMKKIRLTLDDLTSLLREKNYFNINDVNYAILENDGKLSVLPKASKKPLTPSDVQQNPPEAGLTKDIIIDGVVLYENLNSTNLTEEWLFNELNNNGICNAKEVFYAALDTSGKLYISKGNKKTERHGEYGIE
ncbi:MAG: DUF421 domain-containing protein [Bacillota bacterium]|nr:DUF421 domain-containing protein [Bacillota bacterium]